MFLFSGSAHGSCPEVPGSNPASPAACGRLSLLESLTHAILLAVGCSLATKKVNTQVRILNCPQKYSSKDGRCLTRHWNHVRDAHTHYVRYRFYSLYAICGVLDAREVGL